MRNRDDVCSICGHILARGHQCAESSLRAIDAAHKRDPDHILERKKPYSQRLRDGFTLLNADGDDHYS